MPPVIKNPIVVDRTLTFSFQTAHHPTDFEKWAHHSTHDPIFHATNGRNAKKVDVIVFSDDLSNPLWLIEAKDFRIITNQPKPANLTDLHETVKMKVQEALVTLSHAGTNANALNESSYAQTAIGFTSKRVVLHLEPHVGSHSALFPVGFSANVLAKLKQELHALGIVPMVLNIANTPTAGVPWSVR